jgi:hypothetical protein
MHELSRKLYLQTTPPCRGGLRRHHASRGPGPRLLAEASSGTATCPMAPGSAFLRGKLWCYHVSHDFRPCLPKREAPVLPCVSRPPAGCGPQE